MVNPFYGIDFTKWYANPANALQPDEDTTRFTITAADNPKCGDNVLLYLQIEDGKILDGRFGLDACAVCTVSADTMIDAVRGRTLEEAKKIADIFGRMCKGHAMDLEMEALKSAVVMQEVAGIPSRRECAMLPWKALKRAISDEEKRRKK